MDLENYYNYCLSKKGVTADFPFDVHTLVFKVGGKMFALTSLPLWETGTPTINLKCDPEQAQELRAKYDAVKPGYHMNKTHWNTLTLTSEIKDDFIQKWIDHSYDLVFAKLPKKQQATIG